MFRNGIWFSLFQLYHSCLTMKELQLIHNSEILYHPNPWFWLYHSPTSCILFFWIFLIRFKTLSSFLSPLLISYKDVNFCLPSPVLASVLILSANLCPVTLFFCLSPKLSLLCCSKKNLSVLCSCYSKPITYFFWSHFSYDCLAYFVSYLEQRFFPWVETKIL